MALRTSRYGSSRRLRSHFEPPAPLDLVALIGAQYGFDFVGLDASAPFLFQNLDVEAEPLRQVDPQMAELAEPRGQHFIARGKRVAERSLQPPVPEDGKINTCPSVLLKTFFKS